MNRKETLENAIKTVCEDRQDSYGKPEDNFAIIADLWSSYLGDVLLRPEDVAMMMILLKIARIQTGKYKPDNFIDIAGYAACAAEIAERWERNEDGKSDDKEQAGQIQNRITYITKEMPYGF